MVAWGSQALVKKRPVRLTTKQAPHRPGIAPALGLRAGDDASIVPQTNPGRNAMRRFNYFWAAVLLTAGALSLGHPNFAAAANPVLQVNGGGTGLFIEPSVTPTDMDLTTNFGVGLQLYADGSADGHFMCIIQGIVVVDGHYDSATYDSATGIVTASGVGILYFPQFDPLPVEFTNTFKAGGPGEGIFTLSETSGYFPNYPTDVDTEVVLKGKITFH
jgi:hypothetical protein